MINVSLMQRPDGSRFLRVRLKSMRRENLTAETKISDQGSEARNLQAVWAAGGALAEHFGKVHGEQFDASEVARAAAESFSELLAELRNPKSPSTVH